MTLLVTGGAGYIGSHVVRRATAAGFHVVTIDNLSTGHRDAVKDALLLQFDIRETQMLSAALIRHKVTSVLHFAASSTVNDSLKHPSAYWSNNVEGTRSLLMAMKDAKVSRLVFSSTCAIYGRPTTQKLTEHHRIVPVSCYGRTKLACENMISDFARAYQFKTMALRYFNAAGAANDCSLAERHDPETHLIPLALMAVIQNKPLTIFGDDYPTPDGTCVRDYVHVEDLAEAHLRADTHLAKSTEYGLESLNLGTGTGFSVREVLDSVRRVTGVRVPTLIGARRPGDPESLVADATQAESILGWRPKINALDPIIASAWRSMRDRPRSFFKSSSTEETSPKPRSLRVDTPTGITL